MKRNSMAQWINLHRINSFVNRMRLPLLCEKSGAIHLVLVGLMVGWQAVRRNKGRSSTDCIVRNFMAFYEGTYSVIIVLPMHFSQFLG